MTALPRLERLDPITDENGYPSMPFHIYWDKFAKQIEENINNVLIALAYMPDIADIHIAADYTGTPNSGQLPATVMAQRFTGETDNSATSTWSFATSSGGITASIDSNGILTITDIVATSVVTITSSLGGIDKSKTFTAYLDVAAPPSSGTESGSGTTASDSSLSNVSSASYAAVTNELAIVIGSNGKANLSATLTVGTAASSPAGTYDVIAIWRHWNGASYVDFSTSQSSSPDCTVTAAGAKYNVSNGTVKINRASTAFTPGATEKFKLYVKNASGTRTMTLSGTASAVGS